MKRMSLLRASIGIAALAASLLQSAQAGGLERLYILNCGEGTAGDISRWSPGVNVGKAMPFVDNCYLLKHSQGWIIWDTGVPDAVATMADGLKPSDPGATHWYRPKTLAGQLEQLGVKTADIKCKRPAVPPCLSDPDLRPFGPKRQEFINPAIGPNGQFLQRILQPGMRIQPVQLGRPQQALNRGGPLPGAL